MTLEWIQEQPPLWDDDKARIIGGAEPGIFDIRFQRLKKGDLLPGDWWRVERESRPVGYGWMDIVWGDAEILLATAEDARGQGVGAFILDRIEHEARGQGINYIYNLIRPTHPRREAVAAWLTSHGFVANEDGSLFRATLAHEG
jgi:GNAT superfamily N-acetyltransferase